MLTTQKALKVLFKSTNPDGLKSYWGLNCDHRAQGGENPILEGEHSDGY